MNPFEQMAVLTGQMQAILGDGSTRTGGAMMTILGSSMPCTTSPIVSDFDLVPGGQSPTTFIEQLEFLASDFPANNVPKKGIKFSLKLNPQLPAVALQLWHGGLLPGGLSYRFMAVDANYKA